MILVACGLKREADLIERPGVRVITGGGQVVRLERELEAQSYLADAVTSVGLAGALVDDLSPGDWIVDCNDDAWRAALLAALPNARAGRIMGSDAPVATARAKAALYAATGAVAVDMESHAAARVAARHKLPFAAIRVISDRADARLPAAALAGMRADGGIATGAVIGALMRSPGQLPSLLRTAREAAAGFRALSRDGRRWPFPPSMR